MSNEVENKNIIFSIKDQQLLSTEDGLNTLINDINNYLTFLYERKKQIEASNIDDTFEKLKTILKLKGPLKKTPHKRYWNNVYFFRRIIKPKDNDKVFLIATFQKETPYYINVEPQTQLNIRNPTKIEVLKNEYIDFNRYIIDSGKNLSNWGWHSIQISDKFVESYDEFEVYRITIPLS